MQNQPHLTDYEANWILEEINRISMLSAKNPPEKLLNDYLDSLTHYIGYLEENGRRIKRVFTSPVIYAFVGSIADPERDTTAEYFASSAGTHKPMETNASSDIHLLRKTFCAFDDAIRQLKGRVPQPRYSWNEEVHRFVHFLRTLSNERKLETIHHVINLIHNEVEEEAEREHNNH